jgi:hypothetical protein
MYDVNYELALVSGPPNMPLQNQSMFPGQDEENLCNYIIILLKLFSLLNVINNTLMKGRVELLYNYC